MHYYSRHNYDRTDGIHWKTDERLLMHDLFSKKAKTWFPRDKPVKISTHSLTTSHTQNSTTGINPPPLYHTHNIWLRCNVIQPTVNQRITTSSPCANAACQSKERLRHGPVPEKGVEKSLNQSLADPSKLTLASGLARSQVTEINAGRMIG